MQLIAICYKYRYRKDLYFISTDDAESTNYMIKYLSKYPEQFSNNPIQPVVCPLVMFKLFRYINEVDSHNKSRQSDLAFGKVLGCSVWLDTVM